MCAPPRLSKDFARVSTAVGSWRGLSEECGQLVAGRRCIVPLVSLRSKTAKTLHIGVNIEAGFRRRMCDFQICASCGVQKPV